MCTAAVPAHAQSLQRFSIESAISADEFAGERAVGTLQIVDISATVRLSDRDGRKSYGRADWDRVGASVVWSRRWW